MTLEKEGSQREHKPTLNTSLPKLHGDNQNSSDPARLAPGAAQLTDRHTDRLPAEASWALSSIPAHLGSHRAAGRPARPELKGSLCFPVSQAGATLLLSLPKCTVIGCTKADSAKLQLLQLLISSGATYELCMTNSNEWKLHLKRLAHVFSIISFRAR